MEKQAMTNATSKVLNSGNPAAAAALGRGDVENALIAATPGGIEAQEKHGQELLVKSTDMPIELLPNREAFEKVGFKFGDPIDTLFVAAALPPGWQREATDHAMWSHIVDEHGRKRVNIFYKAAFYDRRADARIEPRYTAQWMFPGEPSSGLQDGQVVWVVRDAGKEIHRGAPFSRDDFDADKKEAEAVKTWLKERFPDHEDPTAYW